MTGRAVLPARIQPPLPLERLVRPDAPGDERIELDVLIVGGGPAGLATAIELARGARRANEQGRGPGELQIGVLEKAGGLGEHCLSGAVVNPRAFRELFPDLRDQDFPFRTPVTNDAVYLLTRRRALRLPVPPTMRNHGHFVASVSEIARWLGDQAQALGVDVFPGFPAAALLVDGTRVVGVRTEPSGLGRDGTPQANYVPAADITARVTVLAEGTRGALAQAWAAWQGVGSANPPIFALGVKELWETRRPLDRVVHTLGWPVPRGAFGGSWMYPMASNLVSLGLVVGLDYRDTGLDVHELLQRMKGHPLFRAYLEGGDLVEWGAKTIPEGGYYALPERRHGDGVVVVGDDAGFVDVPSLKGIHYAMQTGMYAARAILDALLAGDTSAAALASYDRMVNASYVVRDLYRTRNMRLAFRNGLFAGGIQAGLMTLTGGRFPGRRIAMGPDATVPKRVTRPEPLTPDGKLTIGKLDAVFKAGNATRDDIPTHLVAPDDGVDEAVAGMYTHMCPAGVYEWVDETLRINAPNCIDCKATDVLGPRWLPREGGSGPSYKRM